MLTPRPIDRLVTAGYRLGIRGTGTIAQTLYGGQPVRTIPTKLNGLRWEADPLDWMDQQILKMGSYEPEISNQLCELLDRDAVYWDVGANSGVHALTIKARRPDVTVVAFEPSPAQYVRLRHHAEVNALAISALCVALADHPGYQTLSLQEGGNSGLNTLRPLDDVSYSGSLTCWCDTGANLISAGVPAPAVLKIDVEGVEDAVLTGMGNTMSSVRSVVFESLDGRQPALKDFAICQLDRTNWLASR